MHRPLLILWLFLCAAALLLLPFWIPSDGLAWKPQANGLRVERVLEPRNHDITPGQIITYVGGVTWRSTEALHLFRTYRLQANGVVLGYEIVDGKWLARRNVALAQLSLATVVRIYGAHSLVLVLLLLAVWLVPMPPLMLAGLAACGTEFAILTISQMSPMAFFSMGLRHLEVSAALMTWGLGALFAVPLKARRLPWLLLGLAAMLWIINGDRWIWWHQMKVMGLAEAIILGAGFLFSMVRKKSIDEH